VLQLCDDFEQAEVAYKVSFDLRPTAAVEYLNLDKAASCLYKGDRPVLGKPSSNF